MGLIFSSSQCSELMAVPNTVCPEFDLNLFWCCHTWFVCFVCEKLVQKNPINDFFSSEWNNENIYIFFLPQRVSTPFKKMNWSFCILICISLSVAACCVWGKQHSSPFSVLGAEPEPFAARSMPVPSQSVGVGAESWQAVELPGPLARWGAATLGGCKRSGKASDGYRITIKSRTIRLRCRLSVALDLNSYRRPLVELFEVNLACMDTFWFDVRITL